MDRPSSRQGQLAGCCEFGNERLGFTKRRKFSDSTGTYWLLRKTSVEWSMLQYFIIFLSLQVLASLSFLQWWKFNPFAFKISSLFPFFLCLLRWYTCFHSKLKVSIIDLKLANQPIFLYISLGIMTCLYLSPIRSLRGFCRQTFAVLPGSVRPRRGLLYSVLYFHVIGMFGKDINRRCEAIYIHSQA